MINQTICVGFKSNLLKGLENFSSTSPYVYKLALYTALADLTSSTTHYSTAAEVVGLGYVAGGIALTPTEVLVDPATYSAYLSFSGVSLTPAAFTTRGGLIYNSTTGAAVCVLNFGADKICTTHFAVEFPPAAPTTALIRIQ